MRLLKVFYSKFKPNRFKQFDIYSHWYKMHKLALLEFILRFESPRPFSHSIKILTPSFTTLFTDKLHFSYAFWSGRFTEIRVLSGCFIPPNLKSAGLGRIIFRKLVARLQVEGFQFKLFISWVYHVGSFRISSWKGKNVLRIEILRGP